MLGFIAWRSGSLGPAILAHFINNAVLVSLGTAGLDRRLDALGTPAQVGLLVGAAALVLSGGAILLRLPTPPPPEIRPSARA